MALQDSKNTNIILVGILIILIVLTWFFITKTWTIIDLLSGNDKNTIITNQNTDNSDTIVTNPSDIVITVINDGRCLECNTEKIIIELRQTPFLKDAQFKILNFSDEWVADMIVEKWITKLPAVLFNTWTIEKDFDGYLTKIDDETFSLNIGAKFDPFQERSDKGFLKIDKDTLKQIKEGSYIDGETDSKITWLEYSDLECPFCAKLHNSSTKSDLISKYGKDLNIIYNHFPLSFHDDAQAAAEALECIAEQKWNKSYYTAIKESYKKYNNNNFDLEWFYVLANEKTWVNIDELKECVSSNKYKEKVIAQMWVGSSTFNVTGTPWNVLINNETWEYQVISGAYPTDSFVEIIDNLLK